MTLPALGRGTLSDWGCPPKPLPTSVLDRYSMRLRLPRMTSHLCSSVSC